MQSSVGHPLRTTRKSPVMDYTPANVALRIVRHRTNQRCQCSTRSYTMVGFYRTSSEVYHDNEYQQSRRRSYDTNVFVAVVAEDV